MEVFDSFNRYNSRWRQAKFSPVNNKASFKYLGLVQLINNPHPIQIDDSADICEIINKYKTLLQHIENNKIQEGDYIKFEAGCTFPKLFLKDADVGLKRTIKEEKADKIIIDKHKIFTEYELNSMKECYIYKNVPEFAPSANCYCYYDIYVVVIADDFKSLGLTIEDVDNIIGGTRMCRILTTDSKQRSSDFISAINLGPKTATTEQLFNYFNSKFPELDNKDMMISMLKSSTPDQQKLAVNMIKAFNLKNCLYDIAEALGTCDNLIDPYILQSINFKYLLQLCCGELNYRALRRIFSNWVSPQYLDIGRKTFCNLYNSNINEDQKLKAWFQFWKLSYGAYYSYWPIDKFDNFDFTTWSVDKLPRDQMEIFDLYNMPYVP